jgi:hypothetical protein
MDYLHAPLRLNSIGWRQPLIKYIVTRATAEAVQQSVVPSGCRFRLPPRARGTNDDRTPFYSRRTDIFMLSGAGVNTSMMDCLENRIFSYFMVPLAIGMKDCLENRNPHHHKCHASPS